MDAGIARCVQYFSGPYLCIVMLTIDANYAEKAIEAKLLAVGKKIPLAQFPSVFFGRNVSGEETAKLLELERSR